MNGLKELLAAACLAVMVAGCANPGIEAHWGGGLSGRAGSLWINSDVDANLASASIDPNSGQFSITGLSVKSMPSKTREANAKQIAEMGNSIKKTEEGLAIVVEKMNTLAGIIDAAGRLIEKAEKNWPASQPATTEPAALPAANKVGPDAP